MLRATSGLCQGKHLATPEKVVEPELKPVAPQTLVAQFEATMPPKVGWKYARENVCEIFPGLYAR